MEHRYSILIIEGHKGMRTLLSDYLQPHFERHTVASSYEATVWLMEGNFPDLIILSTGESGDEASYFLEHLRISGFFEHIPVIVLNAAGSGALTKLRKAETILNKPFNPLKLLDTVHQKLGVTQLA